VPREVAFVSSFPLGPSNKVLKRTLREMLQDGRLRAVQIPSRNEAR
jgi:acyl-coenzyme A synthetase/AMP-(fatty) acid ligase